MAKIASKVLWWSTVEDASKYRIRFTPDGPVPADVYALNYDELIDGGTAEQEVDISTLSTMPATEGVYDIYVTAVDEAGNESDALAIEDAVLDFRPPAAPTLGGFR